MGEKRSVTLGGSKTLISDTFEWLAVRPALNTAEGMVLIVLLVLKS